jgi:IS1 family transposase
MPSDGSSIIISVNRLSAEKRRRVIACLVEGNSIRATVRMTGVAKATVTKLLVDLGIICSVYQDVNLRDLPCERVQCDEIWAFVGAKQKNTTPETRAEGWGDCWTWTALDSDSKLVVSYRVGPRDLREATLFMQDIKGRLRNRVQLTTDGLSTYLLAVEAAFEGDVDYAQLVKVYGTDQDPRRPERRYSPSVCLEAIPERVCGDPDPEHVSTSHVERLNLTTRMSVRRFTRLTNAFSKKVENLAAAVSLHFMHYNFCRPHQSLSKPGQRVTPAMAAGVTDHVWTLDELVALLDEAERAVPVKRGPYKKRQPRPQLAADSN